MSNSVIIWRSRFTIRGRIKNTNEASQNSGKAPKLSFLHVHECNREGRLGFR
jgi:hypothetical protein